MTPAVHSGSGSAAPQSSRDQPPALRDYQHAGIAAIERELAGHRSTLLEWPTGTGKTIAFTAVAATTTMGGGRVLILVHRDELLQQARRKCEANGLHVSVEQGKYRASLHAPVVIASVQSLRGERLRRFDRDHFARIVVDECHHSVAPGYRSIFDHFASAKILGVTATPKRADGVGLGEIFETVAFRYELRDAIRDAWLVPITARKVVLDGVDLSAVRTRAGDLAQDELAEVMAQERAIRGVVDALLELAGHRKTVVFGVDVAHAQKLADELNRRRPGCARAVSGGSDDRAELLGDGENPGAFTRGEFQFLCNCALLTEGWDEPSISCVAIVRPTKSVALYTQIVGRGTRLLGATYAESCRNGKPEMLLLDFTGTAGKHRLIGPVDVLQGDLPDDLRAELDRLLGQAARRLDDVIAQATGTVAQQRVDTAAAAKARWHAEHIDPFIGEPQGDLGELRPGWDEALPTRAQIFALERLGIEAKRLPPRFSMADASRLLGRLTARIGAGLCTFPQARRLGAHGIDTRRLSRTRATELILLLKAEGWHPRALIGQPEAGAEFHRRLQAARKRKLEEQQRKQRRAIDALRDGSRASDNPDDHGELAGEAGAA